VKEFTLNEENRAVYRSLFWIPNQVWNDRKSWESILLLLLPS